MKLQVIKLSAYQTNCYVIYDVRQAIVIDPALSNEVLDFLTKNNLELKYIFNTHGHGDHTGGNFHLKSSTGAKIIIHDKDGFFLKENSPNYQYHRNFKPVKPDILIKEDSILKIELDGNNFNIKVLQTPGHTPGSISLLTDFGLFSGDTIFKKGIGRFDFPYSSALELGTSINKILAEVSRDCPIYPGHGPFTKLTDEEFYLNTISYELKKYKEL